MNETVITVSNAYNLGSYTKGHDFETLRLQIEANIEENDDVEKCMIELNNKLDTTFFKILEDIKQKRNKPKDKKQKQLTKESNKGNPYAKYKKSKN